MKNKMVNKVKIYFLRGLPSSGKSTHARSLVEKDPIKYVRISKDDLRKMFHDGKWSKAKEKMIQAFEFSIAQAALESGRIPIIDSTNFNPYHEERYRSLAEFHGADFEIKEFDTPLDVCIDRDSKRENPVGVKVIMQMYNQYIRPKVHRHSYEMDDSLPDAAIFDADGTLALMKNRGPFDWSRVGEDDVNEPVAHMARTYYDLGYQIIILTGRDGVCEKETKEWLEKHGIKYHHFFIRPEGNTENDALIKTRMFDENIRGKFNPRFIVDDRPRVCDAWRKMGLHVFQVGDPNYDF